MPLPDDQPVKSTESYLPPQPDHDSDRPFPARGRIMGSQFDFLFILNPRGIVGRGHGSWDNGVVVCDYVLDSCDLGGLYIYMKG